MSIENVEQIEQVEQVPLQEAPVEEQIDEVRPDGPGSGRSELRKQLEKGFADVNRREAKEQRRKPAKRAADQYKEGTEESGQPAEAAEEGIEEAPVEAGAPESFPREARAEWHNVPPVVQQAILKREQDSARGVEEIKRKYSEIDQAITPRLEQIKATGHTPGTAVNQLFAWFDSLGKDVELIKAGQQPVAFAALAQSYGIDPVQAFWPQFQAYMQNYYQQQAYQQQQTQQGAPQTEVPQELRPYYDQLAQLNARQAQLEQFYNQKLGTLESSFQAQSQAKTEEMLANWARNKPYYEDVRQMMARLIGSHAVPPLPNGSADLDKAYEMAVYAMPEVRAKILAEQQAKAEAARREKIDAEKKAREEAAAKARKAAGSLAPGAPGSELPQSKRKGSGKSVRDSLMEAWNDAGR